MITFKQFLEESRSAPLYHATHPFAANDISRDNRLVAATDHRLNRISGRGGDSRMQLGASLTRDFRFAKRWGSRIERQGYVIFQIDQRKLAYKHKIVPYNHFQDRMFIGNEKPAARQSRDVASNNFPINQYEEFVLGSIDNFDKYVTKIFYTPNVREETLELLADTFYEVDMEEI